MIEKKKNGSHGLGSYKHKAIGSSFDRRNINRLGSDYGLKDIDNIKIVYYNDSIFYANAGELFISFENLLDPSKNKAFKNFIDKGNLETDADLCFIIERYIEEAVRMYKKEIGQIKPIKTLEELLDEGHSFIEANKILKEER